MSQVGAAPISQRRAAVDSRMSRSSSVEASSRLGFVDHGKAAAAPVEPAEQAGVGHGLSGDLRQALQERDAGKLLRVAVEEADQADDLAAHDQRQADARRIPRQRK